MSRLIRATAAAALAAAAFTPAVASAAPPDCTVTLEYYTIGGTTWTARIGPVPVVTCTP